MTKIQNEERLKEHLRVERERTEEEERQRLQNMQMKIMSKRESALKLQSIQERVKSSADLRKNQRLQNEQKRREDRERAQLEAEAKKIGILRDEARIRDKLAMYKQTRVLVGKPMRDHRVQTESQRISQAGNLLEELENQE